VVGGRWSVVLRAVYERDALLRTLANVYVASLYLERVFKAHQPQQPWGLWFALVTWLACAAIAIKLVVG